MIQIMKRYIQLAVMAVICWTGANAQNGNLPSRSMTIEGAYNPTMTNAEKVMPVPDKRKNKNETPTVSFRTESNLSEMPARKPMEVFASNSDDIVKPAYWGLARLGYGLRNLHDVLFDFGWKISENDLFRFTASADGWFSKPDGKWKSKMFNTTIDAGYEHRFKKAVIGLDADITLRRYNFMEGCFMDSAKLAASNLDMKTKEGSLSGYIRSTGKDGLSYHLEGSGEWMIRKGLVLNNVERSNKEGIIRISAGAAKPLNVGSLSVDYRQKSVVYRWWGLDGCKYDDFSNFTLTPVWHYYDGTIKADAGFNMDIRTRAGNKFLMSPMATLLYSLNSSFNLQAELTGGLEEYDMRTLAVISPYWAEEERIRDGYNVVNLALGATYFQGSWLTLSAKAGYRHTIDEVFQTWGDSLIRYSLLKQQSSNVLYVRLDADMQFSDRAYLRTDITYNDYLGFYHGGKMELKPAFDINLYGFYNILPGLDAMLSYKLRAFHWVNGIAMPAVNDLALTVDYDYNDKLSFYVTLNHLAGGNFYYYSGYRCLKPAFMLGASYRF